MSPPFQLYTWASGKEPNRSRPSLLKRARWPPPPKPQPPSHQRASRPRRARATPSGPRPRRGSPTSCVLGWWTNPTSPWRRSLGRRCWRSVATMCPPPNWRGSPLTGVWDRNLPTVSHCVSKCLKGACWKSVTSVEIQWQASKASYWPKHSQKHTLFFFYHKVVISVILIYLVCVLLLLLDISVVDVLSNNISVSLCCLSKGEDPKDDQSISLSVSRLTTECVAEVKRFGLPHQTAAPGATLTKRSGIGVFLVWLQHRLLFGWCCLRLFVMCGPPPLDT